LCGLLAPDKFNVGWWYRASVLSLRIPAAMGPVSDFACL